MSDRIIVAADPGTDFTAMVVVAPAPGGRIAFVKGSMVPSTAFAFSEFMRALSVRPDAVAIERVEGYLYAHKRAAALLQSQWSGGELSGIARAMGCLVMAASATTWRSAVIGPRKNGQRYDELIARALPTFVEGIDTKNEHVNDAAGLAYWASVQVWKKRAA